MRPRVRRRQCSFLGKFAISFNSEAVGRIEHSRPEPRDRAVDLDSECWQMRANCIGKRKQVEQRAKVLEQLRRT